MSTLRELALLRLVAQRIAGSRWATPAEAARHMTAMQGQDLPGAMTSVALRTEDPSRSMVADAMNAGQIVRSWPMRGTLHLVPAEDLSWMLSLTGPRMIRAAATRRKQRGIDDEMIGRARESAVGTEQRFVLCEEWIPEPRQLGPQEALQEWAWRYFVSHGPATVRDLAWWTKLGLREIRPAVDAVRPQLETVTVDATEYLMDPATPGRLAEARRDAEGVFLLPGFDEFILGYGDRAAALPAVHADKVVPGNNGMFRRTVVARGQVVGTWKRAGSAARPRIEAQPFETFTKTVAAAVPRRFATLP